MTHNVAMEVIESTVHLLRSCIKPDIWNHKQNAVVAGIINKLNEVLIKLGDALEYYRYMLNIFLLTHSKDTYFCLIFDYLQIGSCI